MKTIRMEIDYHRTPESIAATSNIALTKDYLEAAVSSAFPQLQGQKLRYWARAQRKLDDAVEANAATIELEDAEADVIKDAFKNLTFLSSRAKYVVYLMDEIDKL